MAVELAGRIRRYAGVMIVIGVPVYFLLYFAIGLLLGRGVGQLLERIAGSRAPWIVAVLVSIVSALSYVSARRAEAANRRLMEKRS